MWLQHLMFINMNDGFFPFSLFPWPLTFRRRSVLFPKCTAHAACTSLIFFPSVPSACQIWKRTDLLLFWLFLSLLFPVERCVCLKCQCVRCYILPELAGVSGRQKQMGLLLIFSSNWCTCIYIRLRHSPKQEKARCAHHSSLKQKLSSRSSSKAAALTSHRVHPVVAVWIWLQLERHWRINWHALKYVTTVCRMKIASKGFLHLAACVYVFADLCETEILSVPLFLAIKKNEQQGLHQNAETVSSRRSKWRRVCVCVQYVWIESTLLALQCGAVMNHCNLRSLQSRRYQRLLKTAGLHWLP